MIKNADVVIVGGGISGCSTAFRLAEAGVKNIVVIEKRFVCGGSTGACGAGVRMQWGTEMNCRFSKYSIEFFEHAEEELDYPDSIEFKQKGYLMIADKESEMIQFRKNVEVQHMCGIDAYMVDCKQMKEMVPHLNTDVLRGGAFCAKDGFLNPFKTTDAFRRAAKRLGVTFIYALVTDVETENGKIKAVVTTEGRIETPILVDCAGGWAKDIANMAGDELPVYRERHQILVTEPVAPVQDPMVMGFNLNLYVQQSPHGSFIMGRANPTEPRDGRVTSSHEFLDEMSKTIDRILPPIGNLRIVRQWAGLYTMTPDRQPVYDKSEKVEGLYFAIGFSGHGFMFGPITGIVMRDIILGNKPVLDVSRLSLKRFETGDLFIEPSVV